MHQRPGWLAPGPRARVRRSDLGGMQVAQFGLPHDERGRVPVDVTLRVLDLPDVWAQARRLARNLLPFTARRARVLADWADAALFRRGVAELTVVVAKSSGD
jgi:hypothetical protein